SLVEGWGLMAGWGGARTPTNPAVVSGPGQLSRRTDGQTQARFTGGDYGDAQDLAQIQGGARMGAAGARSQGAPGAMAPPVSVTPFDAVSTEPGEPVTAGAQFGDGPGPEMLGLPMSDAQEGRADVQALGAGQRQAIILAS